MTNSVTSRTRRSTSVSAGFYDARRSSSSEAARMQGMAGAADEVSLTALGCIIDGAGVVVADVGAGDSTSLGVALTEGNPTLTYLPVDIRPQAVESHRMHGFHGQVGSATELPIEAGTIDALHARFVFGWLDRTGRRRAVEEMLRVGRGGSRVVIIDYDWTTAAGPDVLVAWKTKLLELLTGFGFCPDYGQRLTVELRGHLSAAGLAPADYSLGELRSVRTQPMRDALGTISELMAAVLDHLAAVGLVEEADELRSLHAAVVDYGCRNPDTPVSFPSMVAATVDFTGTEAVAAATTAVALRRAARRRASPARCLPEAGPSALGVYRLESEELIEQARRLHAAEYRRHRHLTDDSIDADGFLIADIDPPEVVSRSSYLGVLDDEGVVAGCVRMIRPAGGDPMTLPVLSKLAARVGPSDTGLIELPFLPGSVIFEVSGLAKSSHLQDRTITTRLLLAVVSEARRGGDDFGVMGLVATTAKLLITVYGSNAIRRLDDVLGTVALTGTGIRSPGITLVPCYAQTATFVHDLLEHCLARPQHELSRLNRPLIELTAADFAVAGERLQAHQPVARRSTNGPGDAA